MYITPVSSQKLLSTEAPLVPQLTIRPVSPSSAPPNPSAIASIHPPQFIHTHLPRRGSLTPLGLNVISPIAPLQMTYGTTQPPHSPVRSVGFTPNQSFPDAFPSHGGRRGSGASSSSTLTLSRPAQLGATASGSHRDRRRSSLVPNCPPGFNPDSRRSSLNPAIAQPSPPSPTRTHVSGVFGRPTSSDGRHHRRTGSSDNSRGPPPLHVRHHTTHGPGSVRPTSQAIQQVVGDTRRGSMPQLHYGGWNGPRWNPSLPPQRGSVGDEPLPDDEFKFGSVSEQTPTPASAATFALRAIDISPSRRESSNMDAFQEQEVEEAERQQRAFLAATYGADGRRARERLSIGGPVANTPASPSMRRPSLMLWEKLGMAAAAKQFEPEVAASSAPTLILPRAMSDDDLGQRRGSLPIAIPIGGLGRSPSTHRSSNLDDGQTLDEEGGSDGEEEMERYGDVSQRIPTHTSEILIFSVSHPSDRLHLYFPYLTRDLDSCPRRWLSSAHPICLARATCRQIRYHILFHPRSTLLFPWMSLNSISTLSSLVPELNLEVDALPIPTRTQMLLRLSLHLVLLRPSDLVRMRKTRLPSLSASLMTSTEDDEGNGRSVPRDHLLLTLEMDHERYGNHLVRGATICLPMEM